MVISIIAVLAAMLLPTLGHARNFARKNQCLNNIKQLNGFATMYSLDNSDYILLAQYNGNDTSWSGIWVTILWHYAYNASGTISSTDIVNKLSVGNHIFRCPDYRPSTASNALHMGYACNFNINQIKSTTVASNDQICQHKASSLKRPSRAFILIEDYETTFSCRWDHCSFITGQKPLWMLVVVALTGYQDPTLLRNDGQCVEYRLGRRSRHFRTWQRYGFEWL